MTVKKFRALRVISNGQWIALAIPIHGGTTMGISTELSPVCLSELPADELLKKTKILGLDVEVVEMDLTYN
jgi:hypothetical protein